MVSRAAVVVPAEDVAFREIQREAVLLSLNTGRYYGMNAVATRAWTLFAGGSTFGAVIDQLETEFDVMPAVLERDLTSWLESLVRAGLVHVR